MLSEAKHLWLFCWAIDPNESEILRFAQNDMMMAQLHLDEP